MLASRFPPARYLRVVLALGWSDFKMKYRGSVIGMLWSLIYPFVKYFVILNVFRHFVTDIPNYSLYLFLGIFLWEHFSMTTSACISMLYEKAPIIQKVRFPRLLLVYSVGWMHILILIGYLCIYFLAMAYVGVRPTVGLFYLPVIILEATMLSLGVGMLLSAYALKFRDIQYMWGILLQVLFWLTPVMFAYRAERPVTQDLLNVLSLDLHLSLWSLFDLFIRFQPLSLVLFDARRALLFAESVGIPTLGHTLGLLGVCAVFFAAGSIVFHHRSRYFLQEY